MTCLLPIEHEVDDRPDDDHGEEYVEQDEGDGRHLLRARDAPFRAQVGDGLYVLQDLFVVG